MKRIFMVLAFAAAPFCIQAQMDSLTMLHAFAITGYMQPLNDSMTIVQVQLPDGQPVHIAEKLLGVLKHRYENGRAFDTSMIGYGRCHLIKGDYYYFAISVQKGQQPRAGDLLYARVRVHAGYNGWLLKLAAHQVQLQQVDESLVYRKEQVYFFSGQSMENAILDSMVSDIRYTGREMMQQMPASNQLVENGLFKGTKVFDAMQAVTRSDLVEFLKYMIARPQKYAGHTWKISEIFATWMVSGAPQVVG